MFCHQAYECIKKQLINLEGNYLEIGVYDGDSLIKLAAEYPNKLMIGIDPFVEDGNTTHSTLVGRGQSMPKQRALALGGFCKYKNIKFYEMTSKSFQRNILTDSLVEGYNISAVLIDGSHWYDDVIIDINIAKTCIGKKKGLVIFDDICQPDVNIAYNYFVTDYADKITKIERLYETYSTGLIVAAIHLN